MDAVVIYKDNYEHTLVDNLYPSMCRETLSSDIRWVTRRIIENGYHPESVVVSGVCRRSRGTRRVDKLEQDFGYFKIYLEQLFNTDIILDEENPTITFGVNDITRTVPVVSALLYVARMREYFYRMYHSGKISRDYPAIRYSIDIVKKSGTFHPRKLSRFTANIILPTLMCDYGQSLLTFLGILETSDDITKTLAEGSGNGFYTWQHSYGMNVSCRTELHLGSVESQFRDRG